MQFDYLKFLSQLVACKSIAPADDGAIDLVAKTLSDIGFDTQTIYCGEGEDRIKNLYARYGDKAPNICLAGHTDVVPVGKGTDDLWIHPPFSGAIENGVLYGRGAVDMKGGVACLIAAANKIIENHDVKASGSISFLITGDEEADAINGTKALLREVKDQIDYCILAEPTSNKNVVDNIKIGRRGCVHFDLVVSGKQGHAAYPHLADNPINKMVNVLKSLQEYDFDDASEYFDKTTLTIVTVDTGNPTGNVIPNSLRAAINVRTSDRTHSAKLYKIIKSLIESVTTDYTLNMRVSGESFLNKQGVLLNHIKDAVEEIVGQVPKVTTEGGISDARFIRDYCDEIVEIGPLNQTAHQVNERVPIADLDVLCQIFYKTLQKLLKL